ncbi:MAG: hypothetical protein WB239_14735 [Acidimicrobiia bacterium]
MYRSVPWSSDLPQQWCNFDATGYLPPPQGPDGAQQDSKAAIQCIVDAHDAGEDAGLGFTYFGTKGERSRAMLHTHADRSVDFYLEQTIGWQAWLACQSFGIPGSRDDQSGSVSSDAG